MESKNNLRILYTKQLLETYSDENHALTTSDIISLLKTDYGIDSHRTTVARDIALLESIGMDIVTVRSTQNRYFVGSRLFEEPELRLLADAVGSFKLVTAAKSAELTDKLSTMLSVHQAENLKNSLSPADPVKPKNEQIYYIIDTLNRAIELGKKVSFLYTDYAPDKQRIFKNGGRPYRFSAYGFAWSDGFYYVIGFSEKHGKTCAFRVDRIAGIPDILEDALIPPAPEFRISEYTKAVFWMYKGERTTATLLCDNDMMKVIIDRFGDTVPVCVQDSEHFTAAVEISASPTFFGWLSEFSGKIRILSPQSLRLAYQKHLQQILQSLSDM